MRINTGMTAQHNAKPFDIPKALVWQAWKKVKANQGAAGVDQQTIDNFEVVRDKALYKIWNRMSSGSYLPPPVKRVEIAKSDGTLRPLGIPTVADRVAQMAVKLMLEPEWEQHFHPSSFGYRPNKSAHDAIRQARRNCWQQAWVIDLDIKGFFDNIDHDLMLKAVAHMTDSTWAKLYIERWLKAGVVLPDGSQVATQRGTPQGGVISPLLANLFLHVVFDKWMSRQHRHVSFERYADDIIVHCKSRDEAEALYQAIAQRMTECGLTLHPEKSKIVCCKPTTTTPPDTARAFDFLGFTFRRRAAQRADGKLFTGFSPAISNKAKKTIVRLMRDWQVHSMAGNTIVELAQQFNAQIRGWKNYYGEFYKSALSGLWRILDLRLINWARAKYRKQSDHFMRAANWLGNVKQRYPTLFAHWAT